VQSKTLRSFKCGRWESWWECRRRWCWRSSGVVCVCGAAASGGVDCGAVRALHFDWGADSNVSGAGVNDVFCAERGVFGDGSAKGGEERFGAAAGLREARKKQGRSAGLRNLIAPVHSTILIVKPFSFSAPQFNSTLWNSVSVIRLLIVMSLQRRLFKISNKRRSVNESADFQGNREEK
jgi:hypothetical protein